MVIKAAVKSTIPLAAALLLVNGATAQVYVEQIAPTSRSTSRAQATTVVPNPFAPSRQLESAAAAGSLLTTSDQRGAAPGQGLPGNVSHVFQTGAGNVAAVVVTGSGNSTIQLQTGASNQSNLSVSGSANSLATVQNGNNNSSSIALTGNNNSISNTQIGSGSAYTLQHVGNGQSISVTQVR